DHLLEDALAERVADLDRDAPGEGLVDDAVALGQREQRLELLRRRFGDELEPQTDRAEPDGRLAVDGHRAAKVEVSLGEHTTPRHRDVPVDGDRAERHPRARDERLQEHVAGAGETAVTPARRVETRLDERLSGLHGARDAFGAQLSLGPQRDARRSRILSVPGLERALESAQLV